MLTGSALAACLPACLQIYTPDAPAGNRFVQTGAKTKIARMYHATSILTKDGDIFVVGLHQSSPCNPVPHAISMYNYVLLCALLQGGTSNAGFWHSSNEADFSRTPLGVNEYR